MDDQRKRLNVSVLDLTPVLFQMLDKDETGSVTKDELREILSSSFFATKKIAKAAVAAAGDAAEKEGEPYVEGLGDYQASEHDQVPTPSPHRYPSKLVSSCA